MKGKKLILLAMAIVLLLAVPAVVLAAKSDGKAKAKPPTKISAKFEFRILSPTMLEITGEAKGLSPGKNYHSAVYGDGSSVKGVNSCKPADPVDGSMFAGNWGPVTLDGKATLLHVTDADLDKIATISVRRGVGGPAGGPGTSNIVLVCGKVK